MIQTVLRILGSPRAIYASDALARKTTVVESINESKVLIDELLDEGEAMDRVLEVADEMESRDPNAIFDPATLGGITHSLAEPGGGKSTRNPCEIARGGEILVIIAATSAVQAEQRAAFCRDQRRGDGLSLEVKAAYLH